jgi:two-component sensor histidine kinase
LFFFFQFKKEKIFNSLLSEKAKTIEEKNLVIEKSNSKLEQLLKTKEVLLKEIHHRVKNNLQLVMSLLRSQARHGGDEDISSFIEKSQSRIEVIALIHQNLYQTEYVENVNIQDYISSLSEAIVISYQKDNAKIDVKVNAYDVFLDISIAIPIGLIINELITNAIKYAYPNAKYGLISVDLKAISDYDFELVITDYGVGIDDSYEEKKTFGMELVFLLTEQIGGKLVLINKNGLQYFITFNINNHD